MFINPPNAQPIIKKSKKAQTTNVGNLSASFVKANPNMIDPKAVIQIISLNL